MKSVNRPYLLTYLLTVDCQQQRHKPALYYDNNCQIFTQQHINEWQKSEADARICKWTKFQKNSNCHTMPHKTVPCQWLMPPLKTHQLWQAVVSTGMD